MSCLLPTALSKSFARWVTKKFTENDEVRRMYFCRMNLIIHTAVCAAPCYRKKLLTA